MEQKLSPRRRAYDKGLRALLWVCAGVTCALLVFLIGYIFYRGVKVVAQADNASSQKTAAVMGHLLFLYL